METVTTTRVTASVNETKPLSTSDKTEKGSSRVDTSTSAAAPMKMTKPNKTRVDNSNNLSPLTPPDEKRSVSFDLFSNILHDKYCTDINGYNGFINSPAESVDIAVVRDYSPDWIVSLYDRDTEMRVLYAHNQEFFDIVRQVTFEDEEGWENFKKILYSKRDEKPDLDWMNEISEILSSNPPFLVKFKQIIGYYENDNDDNDSTDSSNSSQEDYDDDDTSNSCVLSEPGYIDITPIRNYPEKLAKLEFTYPQFFINAKELLSKERKRRGSTLGGNHLGDDNPLHPNAERTLEEPSETLYEEFKRILTTPRSEMSDGEWQTNIYECLESCEQLVLQFEEMLIPEIPEPEVIEIVE